MTEQDLNWADPVMRAGFVGRGLIYVVIAILASFAIWSGGTPEGTTAALEAIETEPWGVALLLLIALGLLSYAVWRGVAAVWDLEDYGSDGKGMVARAGQIVTAVIHVGLAFAAIIVLIGSGNEEGSSIAKGTEWLMSMPFGRILVGLVGAVQIGAGGYYIHKGLTRKYMQELKATSATLRLQPVLTAGVVAQGVVIAVIGFLFILAAWRSNPDEAGGLGAAFDWLREQMFGTWLVSALAAGLLAFALFCFVNAGYRIIPKLRDDTIETLGQRVMSGARSAARTIR
ncbi:DUF1206 domain-containing protein [Cereibacter changlensis]|nr:DUF1206 domain-containing protein [Cereibacter changlensis]PZX50295.1 uncharacterized protein DUF1206 [Cereibacter changlensis]